MAVTNFIPELWALRINEKMRDALVFGNVVNRDYEGEIRNAGDTVRINQVGDITIAPYTEYSTTVTPEALTDFQTVLAIDQAKYFAFKIDDVDKAQANPGVMASATQGAAWGLRNAIDEYIAALYTEAGSITASTAVDSTNAYAAMLTMGEALTEGNCPEDGRWAVLPPWMATKLALAKVLVTDSGVAAGAFQNGFQGRCAGFDCYVSNNVAVSSTTYYPMFGHRKAITLAQQLSSVEAYRQEASFSDAVKGLLLFGAKVVQPDALAVLTCTENAEP